MYAWLWHKLPFGLWGKLTGSLALVTMGPYRLITRRFGDRAARPAATSA